MLCVTIDNAGQEIGQDFVVKRQGRIGIDLKEREGGGRGGGGLRGG